MKNRKKQINFLSLLTSVVVFFILGEVSANTNKIYQQPTISIPTVTGTPRGVIATVLLGQEDQINVRSGPGVFFEQVGVLLPGQQVPVLGRTAGGDWILIEYIGAPNNSGWIYSPIVSVSPGDIPIVEPPPTPTPEVTQTIDPTLAAQFVETPIPTRLPTFTPAPQLVIPTYEDYSVSGSFVGIPMGLIILIIAGLGILVALFSIIQAR